MIRYVLTLALLLATAVAHLGIGSVQANAARNSSPPELFAIPADIMGYRQAGPDVPVNESINKELETNSILIRNYVAPSGAVVQLTIVFAENTRRSIHFPEVCFTGQGWETHGKAPVPVGVNFIGQGLTLQKGDAREAVVYWFKTGESFTSNYLVNSYYWARDKLLLRSPSTMLIRVGTSINNQGEEAAFQILADFASALTPILLETFP